MKKRAVLEKEAEEISRILIKYYHPEKIILFGSLAWGKTGKYSDIDIFVVKNTSKPRHHRAIEAHRLIDSEWEHNFPLDLVVYTPKEFQSRLEIDDPFLLDIVERGKLLYDKKNNIQQTSTGVA